MNLRDSAAQIKDRLEPIELSRLRGEVVSLIVQPHDKKGLNETALLRLADLQPDTNERYGWNDIGNGNLFADFYNDAARYVPERKKWFVYEGGVWKPDVGETKVMELCKDLAGILLAYANTITDERRCIDYIKHIKNWKKRSQRQIILKDAESVYPIEISSFDADSFLFNCLNGTLDLRTFEFRNHRPQDLLSKISDVKYDPDALCPRWDRFIPEVMSGDEEKALYLQKALGYGLTGDTSLECFFILFGPTSRNGKGTCMETYMKMLGDYGKTSRPDTIAQRQIANGSGPTEDIARLAGARVVNMSEPDKHMVLSAALVKTITGNDTITARYLGENSFEFRPQFKLFVNTNYLPAVTDNTLFRSGRVKVIPFERHFEESERDRELKSELIKPESLSGILNWCMEGKRLIYETGFETPRSIIAATNDYQKQNDKIARFMEDELVPAANAEVRTSEVYSNYQVWCIRNGYRSESSANFNSALRNIASIERKRPSGSNRNTSPTTMLVGYKLKSECGPDTS